MQFIKGGPDVPEALLRAHEDGNVVFFCGAGISRTAQLPDFGGLVERVYAALRDTPSETEELAIEGSRFDAALGLLEDRILNGRQRVRLAIRDVLQPGLAISATSATHQALVALGSDRRSGKLRLVTTNFDRLFEACLPPSAPRHTAPLLPLPKRSRWSGLVYLHGRLPDGPTDDGLDELVVTSADFGRAYLTERWASRFVTELFRAFTVCFIGYSIEDPVVRYMVDALAADRSRGEGIGVAYAFAASKPRNRSADEAAWLARGVLPILYKETPRHQSLHRTIQEWSKIHASGSRGKRAVVHRFAPKGPGITRPNDDVVGRVLWALSDSSGTAAKAFADLDPPPPIDWLGPLAADRYGHGDLGQFGVPPLAEPDQKLSFSSIRRPAPYTHAPPMALIRSPVEVSRWDDRMSHLARWLVRHLKEPGLIGWVVSSGGQLHPSLRTLIERALAELYLSKLPPTELPRARAVVEMWSLILAGRTARRDSGGLVWALQHRLVAQGLTDAIRLEMRELLAPYVRVLGSPVPVVASEDEAAPVVDRVSRLVPCEIGADAASTLVTAAESDARLASILRSSVLLEDFTTLLADALDLMRVIHGAEGRYDRSFLDMPSVTDHPQNSARRDWTALIVLCRDAWSEASRTNRGLARIMVTRWQMSAHPTFRRLALFAAVHSDVFTTAEAAAIIASDDLRWLWAIETRREVLRLLVALGGRLDADGAAAMLVPGILRGPPPTLFRNDLREEQRRTAIDRMIWLRLAKFASPRGGTRSADGDAELERLASAYPEWQLADDERDEFPFWTSSELPFAEPLAAPPSVDALVDWLRDHPSRDLGREDDWPERCQRDPKGASEALWRLAEAESARAEPDWGLWASRWEEALHAWVQHGLQRRSWELVGERLARSDPGLLRALVAPLSWWLYRVADFVKPDETAFVRLVDWVVRHDQGDEHPESASTATAEFSHPVGLVVEAALRWWLRQGPEGGSGIHESLRELLSLAADSTSSVHLPAKVALGRYAAVLLDLDGAWFAAHLEPQFEWAASSTAARSVWLGLLDTGRLSARILVALESRLYETAQHVAELGEHRRDYASLLTFVGVEMSKFVSEVEVRKALSALGQKNLADAAAGLFALVNGAESKDEYWKGRARPFVERVWPKDRTLASAAIARHFAALCVLLDAEFPDAVTIISPWLQPFDELHAILDPDGGLGEHCAKHPEAALMLLSRVVREIRFWEAADLRRCLDAIRGARPDLATDADFQSLETLADRFDAV